MYYYYCCRYSPIFSLSPVPSAKLPDVLYAHAMQVERRTYAGKIPVSPPASSYDISCFASNIYAVVYSTIGEKSCGVNGSDSRIDTMPPLRDDG